MRCQIPATQTTQTTQTTQPAACQLQANYTVVASWTQNGYHYFTVAWAGGRRSTHCLPIR